MRHEAGPSGLPAGEAAEAAAAAAERRLQGARPADGGFVPEADPPPQKPQVQVRQQPGICVLLVRDDHRYSLTAGQHHQSDQRVCLALVFATQCGPDVMA